MYEYEYERPQLTLVHICMLTILVPRWSDHGNRRGALWPAQQVLSNANV